MYDVWLKKKLTLALFIETNCFHQISRQVLKQVEKLWICLQICIHLHIDAFITIYLRHN